MPSALNSQAIPSTLAVLRKAASPTQRVLSVYLSTAPLRAGAPPYFLAYLDQIKSLRALLPAAELDAFEAAAAQAERYLRELTFHAPAIALFASGAAEYFYALALPEPVANQVVWDEQPLIRPIESVLDEFERAIVVLFDAERARILTIYLGAIEFATELQDTVPGRQATGGWAALAQSRFARHREDHLLRHAKRVIEVVGELARDRPATRLFLAGPQEPVAFLRRELPATMRQQFQATLPLELFATDADVLRAVLPILADAERRGELGDLSELLEAATSDYVALGFPRVLGALADGQVHRLFVSESLSLKGAECPSCGRLTTLVELCPACGSETHPVGDLADRAIQQALAAGSRVELLRGEAGELLLTHGGLGAWLRYPYPASRLLAA